MRFDQRIQKHLKTVETLYKLAVEHDIGQDSPEFKAEYRDMLTVFIRASANHHDWAIDELEKLK